jgi:hypothetical protein
MSGQFFAIDRRNWARACGFGINAAVAYMVLARGSGRDQRSTSWSAHAVETYTGISRTRAKAGVEALKAAELVRLIESGSRPRYEITAWHAPGKRKPAEPEWIWLPNGFVTGVSDETPPLELLRQTQDHMVLRLAVDLYWQQNLVEDGGVTRNTVWKTYERFEAGRQAQFTIWGFRREHEWVRWNDTTNPHKRTLTKEDEAAGRGQADDFFARTKLLANAGIIEWVQHLVESENPASEVIHPMTLEGDGIEARLGRAAHRAGRSMLTDAQRSWADEQGLTLAPVPRHITNVQMVGIARLRYRPHTKLTAAWWSELAEKGEALIAKYEQLADRRIAA